MTVVIDRVEIEGFQSVVAGRLGLHFDDSKHDFLAEILRGRMAAAGCDRFSVYRDRILSSPQEMRFLAEQITVCETYFFRYAEHFKAFTEVAAPARMRAQRGLRLLSAGCSSGEEAYSMAMTILDFFPEIRPENVSIR